MSHPTQNLVRQNLAEPTGLRSSDPEVATGNLMVGHFAVYDRWAEINSVYEGHFLERVRPGAFDKSFAERADRIRVLYEHGKDPAIGNKPLGVPKVMRSDETGAYYEVELFDASYVRDLKPAIAAGQMGASFRMGVEVESWHDPVKSTEWNPKRLPERSIAQIGLYEFGPCPFGAYAEATAGLRSGTDEFFERLASDPLFVARFTERVGVNVAAKVLSSGAADGSPRFSTAPDGPGVASRGRLVASARTSILTLKG